jgi:hypothetical protein
MGDIGLERTGFPSGNTAFSDPGGAYSGALPDDLGLIAAHWHLLTVDDRRRIRAIVEGRIA